jgi:GTP-binding protein
MNVSLKLEATVYTPGQLDPPAVAQVAMAGRSNVGKSSLINCLAGRTRSLAKVSATPGKTRSINFYRVAGHELYLVDLPGYGYAKTSKAERAKWAELIEAYIQKTEDLHAVVMLLDSRHPPQKLDLELADYLRALAMPIVPVLTKADKCKQAERAARQREWRSILPQAEPPLLFSSKTGMGRDKLWQMLLRFADIAA